MVGSNHDFKNVDLKDRRSNAFVTGFVIRRMFDDDPDLSYLQQEYKDCTPQEAKKYMEQDKERLEAYGRTWNMIGIRAECTYCIPVDAGNQQVGILQQLTSGGLWGIESNSGEAYFKEVEDEELVQLKDYCDKLGIKYDASTPVEHKDY